MWREIDGPAADVAPSAGKDVSSLLAEGLHSGEVVREQIIEEHALDLRQTPLIGGAHAASLLRRIIRDALICRKAPPTLRAV